ncbi:MAG: hypothetical protein QXX08_05880 [Candidatus Bathyarchaeia archaeon]
MDDHIKISGFIVLFVGVGVLVFTFYNAYLLLSGVLSILGTGGLMELFGIALAPLIESAIRVLYLGVMGWIGSILTRRGVQILTVEREETKEKPKIKTETEKTKEFKEAKQTAEVAEAQETKIPGETKSIEGAK